MTDEKMTDETLANAIAQRETGYFQRHVDLTFKQYNLLLKLFQGVADSCLAEGRKRCAEESKEREKQAAKEAARQMFDDIYNQNIPEFDNFEKLWALQQQREGREK